MKTSRKDRIVVPLPPKEGESCPVCLRRSDKYSGWTNYETWNLALWLDNEEGTQRYWTDRAEHLLADARVKCEKWNTPREEAIYRLANELKDAIGNDKPDLPNSVYADILGAALGSINYYEVAEHFLQ